MRSFILVKGIMGERTLGSPAYMKWGLIVLPYYLLPGGIAATIYGVSPRNFIYINSYELGKWGFFFFKLLFFRLVCKLKPLEEFRLD